MLRPGWLVATLAGAAAGGVTGGAVRALTEAGISKDEADVYAEGLRRGGAVVSALLQIPTPPAFRQYWINRELRVAERAAAYRSPVENLDPNATPYDADRSKEERSLYM